MQEHEALSVSASAATMGSALRNTLGLRTSDERVTVLRATVIKRLARGPYVVPATPKESDGAKPREACPDAP
jgi:hypothetical protein